MLVYEEDAVRKQEAVVVDNKVGDGIEQVVDMVFMKFMK